MAQRKQAGFTIVELMIATAIFSMILLLCTFGLLQIGRTYYRGVTTSRTQDTTRRVVDMLSQAIQYGATVPAPQPTGVIITNGTYGHLCFGDKRFAYWFNKAVSVDSNQHALVLDTNPGGCPPPPPPPPPGTSLPAGAQELLGENMRLSKFSLTKNQYTSGYEIQLKISHGENEDLILPTNVNDETFGNCQIQARAEFCASSELMVTVQRRVAD